MAGMLKVMRWKLSNLQKYSVLEKRIKNDLAKESLVEAHHTQTSLLRAKAAGKTTKISLLMGSIVRIA